MAQNFICDSCNKHEEPDRHYSNLWPVGWYSVMVRYGPTRHACSAHCLITLAKTDILHSEPPEDPASTEPRLALAEEGGL